MSREVWVATRANIKDALEALDEISDAECSNSREAARALPRRVDEPVDI